MGGVAARVLAPGAGDAGLAECVVAAIVRSGAVAATTFGAGGGGGAAAAASVDRAGSALANTIAQKRPKRAGATSTFVVGKQPNENSSTATPLNNQQPLPEFGSPKRSTETVRDALV